MKRTHVSATTPGQLIPMPQVPSELGSDVKPVGLWYEVDGDWQRWCAGEMPDWLEGRSVYAVDLGNSNVLRIQNEQELDRFHSQYAVEPAWMSTMRARGGRWTPASDHWNPDWPAVAEQYDGIEIAPYIWSRRLKYAWYYGFDCASGCLWRPRQANLTYLTTLAGDVDKAKAEAERRRALFKETFERLGIKL